MTELDLKMQELRRKLEEQNETIAMLERQNSLLKASNEKLKNGMLREYDEYISYRSLSLDLIINHYGLYHQSVVAMEEMAELTKELSKAIRGKGDHLAIEEEVADVQVMLWQIVRMYLNKDYIDIETAALRKIERTIERMKEGI